MTKSVDYFYTNCKDAMQTAEAIEERLGIVTSPLGDTRTLDSYRVTDEALYIDPNKPFIVFNGDGYFHNSTLGIVKDLIKKRRQNGQPEISYVHIDGHDDIAPPEPDNFESYKSFVLGIDAFNRGGVHILQEGLTGQQDGGFIQPSGPESWGETTDTLRDPYAYVSIDIDVLDIDALRHGSGIYHLFPQSPTALTRHASMPISQPSTRWLNLLVQILLVFHAVVHLSLSSPSRTTISPNSPKNLLKD